MFGPCWSLCFFASVTLVLSVSWFASVSDARACLMKFPCVSDAFDLWLIDLVLFCSFFEARHFVKCSFVVIALVFLFGADVPLPVCLRPFGCVCGLFVDFVRLRGEFDRRRGRHCPEG